MEKSATCTSSKSVVAALKLFAFSLILPLFFSSCDEQRVQVTTWYEYEPVYMSEAEFKNSVGTVNPRNLVDPGKIYLYQDYLFVNETNEGIHIFDNSDPADPVNLGFINIPANKDISVRNNLLYADSQSDLLVFDITDIQNPEFLHREEGVFEFSATKDLGFPYQKIDPEKGIVVDWKKVKRKEVCGKEEPCGPNPWNRWTGSFFTTLGGSVSNDANGNATIGVGGSMARFTIRGNYLYAVDDEALLTFDITNQEPAKTQEQQVGWRIETIFPYENHLYIGSMLSMYIFDINNPATPQQTSQYQHFTACDPVVVQNDVAYVTLRSGRAACPRTVNRMELIDVEDPENPQQITAYGMENPHGLGVDGDYLFVSEGDKGIKIFEINSKTNLTMLRFIDDIKTFDVIPADNILMITGKGGIIQYDYTDIQDIKHLSTIPVVEEENS